jgi:hypothetical protein
MEEHAVAVAASMDHSREQLRRLILPQPGHDGAVEAFPRSAVMRFLLDSRKRRMATAALSVGLMLLGRRHVAKAGWLRSAASFWR